MGAVAQPRDDRRLWFILLGVGLLAGLALRVYLAGFAQTPGHGDSAFYYTVAKNIVSGRGPVIDYIVYFFGGLLPLPHYAGDFWNPSAAYLVAIPMALFGKSIGSALAAGIVAGVVPAAAALFAGRYTTGSLGVGVLAAILTFFSPFEVWFSVTTEAIIFAGAFGSVALYFMMKGDTSPRFFVLAAVFTGLANLMRQDNILLFAALECCILLAALTWKRRLQLGAAALAVHLLVLSPLLIENYSQLHVLFPAGPGKTAFLTTYEDFHSYGKRIDWYTLRATWGLQGILQRRLHTANENLGQVEYFTDPVLGGLALLAAADLVLLQRRWRALRPFLPALLFALFEYLFYSFVASFSGPGSLIKCLATLLPFICLLLVQALWNRVRAKSVVIAAVLALSAYCGYQGFQRNYVSTTFYNGVYRQYDTLKAMVQQDARTRGADPAQVAIMARDTWDVNEGTGFDTVMIPNNDIPTILKVAAHYNAHYLLLPGKRPQLDKILTGVGPDPRFHPVGTIPGSDMRVFYMDFPAGG
jgi:hypothetical protein